MNKNGPILVIEDDNDDREVINIVYNELDFTNKLVFLHDGDSAIKYLQQMTEVPFLIISDINMPKMDGLELRKQVQKNELLNSMCIPYLMLSTNASRPFVESAFSTGIQGYFQKPNTLSELKEMLYDIIKYWKTSRAPGMFMNPPINREVKARM
jgi:CheY-like chemotaxis protein